MTSATGLSAAHARRILAELDPNAVAEEKREPWRDFLAKLWGPVPCMQDRRCPAVVVGKVRWLWIASLADIIVVCAMAVHGILLATLPARVVVGLPLIVAIYLVMMDSAKIGLLRRLGLR